ncbi:MAG: OB-fold nucleic acid binding domain-containing protein [Candidatus Methanofastidiosia archaeon]
MGVAMTAVKLRIQDLIEGTFDGTCVHTLFGEVSEARILGTLIDIFTTDDESYISLTVDDGTETIRIKAWRQDVKKLKQFSRGDFIEVVGKVREYNEEIYLTPEVVSAVSPNRWILRELELMKVYLEAGAPLEKMGTEPQYSQPRQPANREAEEERDMSQEPVSQTEGSQPEKGPLHPLSPPSDTSTPEVEIGQIEEFEILEEDEVVETVLDLLEEGMTKEDLIEQSGLDEIDIELSLRELLDEKKIRKEGDTYRRVK